MWDSVMLTDACSNSGVRSGLSCRGKLKDKSKKKRTCTH